MGQRHRPAQLGSRDVIVTRLAGFEAILDGLGELGLAGVVGHMPADPGGQRLVAGPDRPDQALAEGLRARCRVEDQADPSREHLLADRSRLRVHTHVVVAALGTPRAGRVVARLRRRLGASAGEILDGGRDLLDEADRGALRRPDPQRDVGHLLGHRGLHHRLEVGGQPVRVGHDVDGIQQRGGDLAVRMVALSGVASRVRRELLSGVRWLGGCHLPGELSPASDAEFAVGA